MHISCLHAPRLGFLQIFNDTPRLGHQRTDAHAQLNIFIVGKDSALSASAAAFEEAGAKVSALASPEEVFDAAHSGSKPPDVIIADWKVFGNKAGNLFRAMHELYPAAGIVMLSEGQGDEALQKEPWFVHLEHGFSKDALLDALVRSRPSASG